jgi:hypothetical protein
MNKYFIISRSILIIALLILLMAIFWGLAHRTRATETPELNQVEKYVTRKSGSGSTIFFVSSICLGIAIVIFSIYLEFRFSREEGRQAFKNKGESWK